MLRMSSLRNKGRPKTNEFRWPILNNEEKKSPKRAGHEKSFSNTSFLSKTLFESSKMNISVSRVFKIYESKFVSERKDEPKIVENIESSGRFLLWESKHVSSSKLLRYLYQSKGK